MSSAQALSAPKERLAPARIGLIGAGAGAMGEGALYQTLATPNVRSVALCDVRLDFAVSCAEGLGVAYEVVETAAPDTQNWARRLAYGAD